MGTLHLILEYLLASVFGVVICRSLRLPPVLAYLTIGVVLGPYALALGSSQDGAAAPFGRVWCGVFDVRDGL